MGVEAGHERGGQAIQRLYVTKRKTKELRELLATCEKLVRLNMSELYERNQWKNMYSDKMGYCTNSKLKELQQPGILYFVRNNEPAGQEDVAGFLKLDLADDAFVMELQVQPCAQSRGIGSQLLKSAFNDVQAAGYKALNLCVQRGNDRALNFYTNKMGFKITDEFPSYYLLSHDIN